MPKEMHHKSSYTNGEAKTLIAPLMGCQPDELGEILIIARDASMHKLGVFQTVFCGNEQHSHFKAINLIGEYLQNTAQRMHELSPHHGPNEG